MKFTIQPPNALWFYHNIKTEYPLWVISIFTAIQDAPGKFRLTSQMQSAKMN